MSAVDEKFMSVALECAARGRGAVEPNPPVGAVIARDGREISRGWHRRFGGLHAEREALSAATAGGADVRGATMYVSLEPCRHHGKTPPCTDAIIEAGLARVVVAMEDADANVSGRGIAALRNAGIDVAVGVMEAEARALLAAYVKLRTQGRPWVICKWAQTADGYLALPPGKGRWISGEEARAKVHELRGLCDGVLIGAGTVLADDPLLTNRSGGGRQPARIVLDSQLRIPPSSRLVRSAGEAVVIVASSQASIADQAGQVDALKRAGVEILALPAGRGGLDLAALLDELGRRQWTYLLAEGGEAVLRSLISARLADELIVFTSPRTLTDADLPRLGIDEVRESLSLQLVEQCRFGEDLMQRFLTNP